MFSSNSIKIFFALVLLSCQSCGFWRGKTDVTAAPPSPFVAEELKSEIPFSTEEPNVYQTEIVIVVAGNDFEEKTFVARNGANRLTVFNYGGKQETALLQFGANQSFLIARNQKIYAESQSGTANEKDANANDFLTAEWLNQKTSAKFEALGAENNLVKYRAVLDDSPNSEAIIYIDEKIGLPVKEEFYKTSGEQKFLTLTAELKNFNSQTEAKVFEVPKDFRKVSMKEFQEARRRELTKEK